MFTKITFSKVLTCFSLAHLSLFSLFSFLISWQYFVPLAVHPKSFLHQSMDATDASNPSTSFFSSFCSSILVVSSFFFIWFSVISRIWSVNFKARPVYGFVHCSGLCTTWVQPASIVPCKRVDSGWIWFIPLLRIHAKGVLLNWAGLEVDIWVCCNTYGNEFSVYSCHAVGLFIVDDSCRYVYTLVRKYRWLLSLRKAIQACNCLTIGHDSGKKIR